MSDLAIQTKTLTKNYGSVRALRGVDRVHTYPISGEVCHEMTNSGPAQSQITQVQKSDLGYLISAK